MNRIATTVFLLLLLPSWALAQDPFDYIRSRIDLIRSRQYEHKMISSGDNFPIVNIRRNHRDEVLLLLSEGIPELLIASEFGWSHFDYEAQLELLLDAGLVKISEDRRYVPTVMIMSLGDVSRYMPVSHEIIGETAALIVRRLPRIQTQYEAIPAFRDVPFDSQSLLVLSNVLLDNWQINDIESGFLEAERPLRGGKRFYYSLQEKAHGDRREAFGIYGNQYRRFGHLLVGVYGNRRSGNPANLLTLDRGLMDDLFGLDRQDLDQSKEEVLRHYVAHARDSVTPPESITTGLEVIGWLDDGIPTVPLLDSAADSALSSMAEDLLPSLIQVLDRHRSSIRFSYENSPHAGKVTFEEYFMWWYHLFYTAVTDKLIREGHISLPESGITSYLFVE